MKKLLSVLLIIGCIIFLTKSYSATSFITNPDINRTIKVGVDYHSPPFTYIDDNGIVKGFNIDILRAIGIEIGIDIEPYPVAWYEIENSFKNREIDGFIGANVDDESFVFTESFIESQETIFVRTNNKYIVNLDDLKSARVAIYSGNLTSEILRDIGYNYNFENIRVVDNQQHGILMLMNGEVEAFIGNKMVGLYTIQKWMQEDYIKTVGDVLNEKNYVFVVNEEDKELVTAFNRGLRNIKSNGTYDKIYRKWFGETIVSYKKQLKEILFVVGVILLVLFSVAMFILRLNSLLKKEVRKRTKEIGDANKKLLQQKEQLENNDRFKEDIINSVQSGIVTIDKEQKITSINSIGLNVFNIEKEDILNKNIAETILLDFFNINKLSKVLYEGNCYMNQEIEIIEDNDVKTYINSLYPLRDSSRNVIGAILSFEDISQEKKMREELVRMDKMKSLGLMVAGFAHEIRNPLTSIKALTDLMARKIDNPKFKRRFMEIVPNEINRLDSLITDLLEYAKPQRANIQIIRLKGVLDNIVALFHKNFKDKNINLFFDIDDNIEAYADKQQMKQVFINLILNSIEAISDNGNIKISAMSSDEFIEIIIEDNGTGMPKENLNKIMDPFFTTKSEGTGLGLFMCYQIVKKNNGYMSIDSKLNSGTRVSVKLLAHYMGGEVNE